MKTYRLYCNTENQWHYVTQDTAPVTCPIDAAHSIDSGSVVIVNNNDAENVNITNDEVQVTLPIISTSIFGHIRTSETINQVVLVFSQGSSLRVYSESEISGSGTGFTIPADCAYADMSVGTGVGFRRLVSKTPGHYRPGFSQQALASFCFVDNESGVSKRVGMFDSNQGIYLSLENGDLYIVKRTKDGETVTETKIEQSNWNIDKFDGTNRGYNFDVTKCHIICIQAQWLGVGVVNVGFLKDDNYYIAHQFSHVNASTIPYVRHLNLPINYEIERTVTGANQSKLRAICGVISSEGSDNTFGVPLQISQSLNSTYNTGASYKTRALCLFRLKPTSTNSRIVLRQHSININSSTRAYIKVIESPTFSPSYTPTWETYHDVIDIDFSITSTQEVTNNNSPLLVVSGDQVKNGVQTSELYLDDHIILGRDSTFTPIIYAYCIEVATPNVNVSQVILSFAEVI